MLDLTRIDEAVRSEGGITRRLLLAYGAALAGLPALGARGEDRPQGTVKLPETPWTLGVASGDPAHDSVVIWTRLAPKHLEPDGGLPPEDVEVQWIVAHDERLRETVRTGTAVARARLAHSVHVTVDGLEPDRWYWYGFRVAGYESTIGRTRTTPRPESVPKELRFAFASCQNFEEGYYTAYRHMADDHPDLVVHLGDYIYEGAPKKDRVRRHTGTKACRTLADYRLRHSLYRHDADLRRMHARCPWVVTWDDHEVQNNYADDVSSYRDPKAEFLKQRAAAYQAYYEMLPLRAASLPKGADARIHRTLSFGRLASFQVLDTRQHRTPQPHDGKLADIDAKALAPGNTMLGAAQRRWLEEALVGSGAVWNVLAQQVTMGLIDPAGRKEFSMDSWPGYAHERAELLRFLSERRIANPVVLTGDKHSSWVNELRIDDRRLQGPPVAVEFVGTSISSKGNGKPVSVQRMSALQSVNPFVRFHDDQRGYVRCTVTPEEWKSEFQVVSDIERPGGTAKTQARFVVEAGRPGVHG